MAIRIAAIGLIFGLFLADDRSGYLHHVATGILGWTFISSAITAGSTSIIEARSFLNGMPTPKLAFPIRATLHEALIMAQNLLIVPVLYLLVPRVLSWEILLFPFGFAIAILAMTGLASITAIVVARFPDFAPLISSAVGVLFFAAPIVWEPSAIESELAHLLLGLNPFYHLLQVVRLPLMGIAPTDINWLLSGLSAILLPAIGIWLTYRYRNRIGFWV